MKRITLVLGMTASVIATQPAHASTVTGRHFGVYRFVYRHAMHRFGPRTVGCELIYVCKGRVTDEVVVASTHTLEAMLHPRVAFRVTAGVPAPSLAYGSWAIPSAIVQCESHFQNLAPNSAGASGYYQIIPSTWRLYGGGAYASQAYLASKSAQDTIAGKIWDGGRGSGQWVCKA